MVFLVTGCNGKGASVSPDLEMNSGSPDGNTSDNEFHPGPNISGAENEEYLDGEVLVVFEAPTETLSASLQNDLPLRLIEKIDLRWGTVYRMKITDSTTVEEMVSQLQLDADIKYAEPNYILYFDDAPYFPNDPMYAGANDPTDPMDSVYDQWAPAMIGANIVWNDTIGSSDVVVAVIDTGVRKDHEDLTANVWINEDEIPDNSIDDDENGWIDDTWGWDCWYVNNYPWDDGSYASYHGTACSGIVAATQDNNKGLSGIAPGVRVMALKINLTGAGGVISTAILALYYASINDADIASMSFGINFYSEILEAAIIDAWDDGNGIILMASAGNSNSTSPKWPASYTEVMAIGATIPWNNNNYPINEKRIQAYEDGYYWGSNYGELLTVMGFGEKYTTTYGGSNTSYWDGTGYPDFFGGTSAACPMAAGVMALIRTVFPHESNLESITRLMMTADDLDIPGHDIQTGMGRVNAVRAIYGSDRFTDEEDSDGYVPLEAPQDEVYDTIHDQLGNPYHDIEDRYKFIAEVSGLLALDLQIFTRGEDLDIAVYDSPNGTIPIAEKATENNANNSFEHLDLGVNQGEQYYIRVTSAGAGNSTTYGLLINNAVNDMTVTGESIAFPFIHQQGDNLPFLKLDFSVGHSTTISELRIMKAGTVSNTNLTRINLYEDTNANGEFGPGDLLIANEIPPGINAAFFKGLNKQFTWQEPWTIFVTADISNSPDNTTIQLILDKYKDITVSAGTAVAYDQFPISSDVVTIGTDTDPPVWVSTVGVQSANPGPGSGILEFNSAIDAQTPPVKYNIYYTDTLPFDFGTASAILDAEVDPGSVYEFQYTVTQLMWEKDWYFVIRAEDQVGNEDENIVMLSVVPDIGGIPTDPLIYKTIPYPSYDVAIDGDLLVTAELLSGVRAYDRTDPMNPVEAGFWSGNSGYREIDLQGNFAFVGSSTDLTIVDFSDVGSPLSTYIDEDIDPVTLLVNDDWLYVSESNPDKLHVLGIADPYNPTYNGYFEQMVGAKGEIVTEGSYLYFAQHFDGIRVYDITDPGDPTWLNDFSSSASTRGVCIGNGLIHPINFVGWTRTYDLSLDPVYPPFVYNNNVQLGNFAESLVYDDYVIILTEDNGLFVYDVSIPDDQELVGHLEMANCHGIANDGGIIYLASDSGLHMIL
jgi:subtilisin family serine protease